MRPLRWVLAVTLMLILVSPTKGEEEHLVCYPLSKAELAQDQVFINKISPRFRVVNGSKIFISGKQGLVLDMVDCVEVNIKGYYQRFCIMKKNGKPVTNPFTLWMAPGEVREQLREEI